MPKWTLPWPVKQWDATELRVLADHAEDHSFFEEAAALRWLADNAKVPGSSDTYTNARFTWWSDGLALMAGAPYIPQPVLRFIKDGNAGTGGWSKREDDKRHWRRFRYLEEAYVAAVRGIARAMRAGVFANE